MFCLVFHVLWLWAQKNVLVWVEFGNDCSRLNDILTNLLNIRNCNGGTSLSTFHQVIKLVQCVISTILRDLKGLK